MFSRVLPDGYVVHDDAAMFDVDVIHRYIAEESYWGRARTRAVTQAAIAGSLCVGLFTPDGVQAGFARAVTDRATMAHLSDVFVLAAHRGHGHGQALVEALLFHPELRTVRRWSLSTSDAHSLYARYGFGPISEPQKQMMRMVDVDPA
jgi:GNAT superfamily N-acetyltransferase